MRPIRYRHPYTSVGIIPARGGSKSIPRKNIRPLGRLPLIAHSIKSALSSSLLDRVIVSTDDPEIAAVACRYGADVPFLRPATLAQDHTTDLPVFQHALEWLQKEEAYTPDWVVQIRPTSPFRPNGLIDAALQRFAAMSTADSLRTVTRPDQNPFKMWKIRAGLLVPLLESEFDEPYNMPRQALPAVHWQTGHLDIIRREVILQQNSMSGKVICPYEIDSAYAIDLDTLEQWAFAEYLLQGGRFATGKNNPLKYKTSKVHE
ncbi:MAG: acylneuraminate cytidylyltransferase family protein [Bacteroidota bacterium]